MTAPTRPGLLSVPLMRTFLLSADVGTSEEEICRSGTYYGSWEDGEFPARKVVVPASAIDDMSDVFALEMEQGCYPDGMALTVNHDMGQAWGRIQSCRPANNDAGGRSLLATVRWSTDGAILVREGKFAGFSAEVDPAERASSPASPPRWIPRTSPSIASPARS